MYEAYAPVDGGGDVVIVDDYESPCKKLLVLPSAMPMPSTSAMVEASDELMYEMKKPIIFNVIAAVNLGSAIELRKMELHMRSAKYNPCRFPGAVIRLREPPCTYLVFACGKLVCLGSRSEFDAQLGARKCSRILQKIEFNAKFIDFKVQSMIGLVDLRLPIRPKGLLLVNEQMTQYEPEIFPRLIYRVIKSKLALLIFVNGKIVVTATKSRQQMYAALNNVYLILYDNRKAT